MTSSPKLPLLHKIEDLLKGLLSDTVLFRLILLKHWLAGERELRLLKNFIPPDSNTIDIGANRGVFSHQLSKLSNRVFAFEPNPTLASFIERTKRQNISVSNEALSNYSGAGELCIPRIGQYVSHNLAMLNVTEAQVGDKIDVTVSTLDTHNELKNISFIKIDVEGHEKEVLEGARQTISRHKPVLMVEIEQRHFAYPMTETFEFIQSMDYEGFFFEGKQKRSLHEFSYESHQAPYLDPTTKTPNDKRYVNNFFFTPTIDQ